MNQFVIGMKLEGDATSLERAASTGKAAIDGLGKEASQAGAALDTLGNQLERNATSGERLAQATRQAATVEKDLRASIDSSLGIGAGNSRSSAQAAQDVAAFGQQLDRLRARYEPLFAVQQRYRDGLAAIDQAERQGAISASTAIDARLREKAALDAQVSSINSVASAKKAAAEQQVARATVNPGADRAADIEAYGKALDALRARYNPVYAASKRYEEELAGLDEALNVGAINAQEHGAALEVLNARYTLAAKATMELETATGGLTRSFGLNRAGMMELRASGVNAMQALAAGMSPFQVAMMEGSQVVGAFVQGAEGGLVPALAKVGSGVAGAASAIMGMVGGPIPALAIGATAATGAFVAAFSGMRQEAVSSEEVLKEYKTLIEEIGTASDAAAEKIRKMVNQPVTWSTMQADIKQTSEDIHSNLGDQFQQLQDKAKAFSTETAKLLYSANPAEAFQTGFATQGVFASIDKADQKIGKLVSDVVNGKISARDALEQLNQLRTADTYPPSLDALLKQLRDIAKQAVDDQQKLDALGKQDFPLLKKGARPGSEADRHNQVQQEGRLGNPDVTDLRQKLIQQQQSGALGALAEAQHALQTVNLSGYAKQLADINFEIDRQIKLNPEDAATWEKVRQAQIAALNQQTTVVPLRQASEQIDAQARLLAVQAASLGKSKAAAEEAAYAQQLINKFIAEGVQLTPDLISKIDQLAARYGNFIEESQKIDRVKQGFEDIRQTGTNAIDSLVDALSKGSTDFKSLALSIGQDIAKTGLELSLGNPLKNSLYGTNLPTIQDVGGIGGFFKTLLGGGAAGVGQRGSPTNPMYVAPAIGTGGLGGLFGNQPGNDPWSGLRNLVGANDNSGAGGASPVTGGVAGQVWNFFAGKGLQPHQIAGILGNVSQESSFNPLAIGDNFTSGGLFQDHGSRFSDLLGFIGGRQNMGDVQGQLENAWRELQGPESGVLSRLLAAPDVRSATAAFAGFERPAGFSVGGNPELMSGWTNRLSAATDALTKFGGSAGMATNSLTTLGTNAVSDLSTAASTASEGLGKFGGSLMNWFPSAPGGGMNWLKNTFNAVNPMGWAQQASLLAASPQAAGLLSSGAVGLFDGGGFTGHGAVTSIAGYVHGQEYVFDAPATKAIGVDNLEALRLSARRGFATGGYAPANGEAAVAPRPWMAKTGQPANSNPFPVPTSSNDRLKDRVTVLVVPDKSMIQDYMTSDEGQDTIATIIDKRGIGGGRG